MNVVIVANCFFFLETSEEVRMPKSTWNTAKGKLTYWLRHNPGIYVVKELALQHGVSRAVVASTLAEGEANGWATKELAGCNTRWVIRSRYILHPLATEDSDAVDKSAA